MFRRKEVGVWVEVRGGGVCVGRGGGCGGGDWKTGVAKAVEGKQR